MTVARWYRPEAIVNQHIFKVVPNPGQPGWLLYDLLKMVLPHFRRIAADKATTMGHIQRHHLDVSVRVPRADALAEIADDCAALWERALVAEQQAERVAETAGVLIDDAFTATVRDGA